MELSQLFMPQGRGGMEITMALHQMEFSFTKGKNSDTLPIPWSHTGIVGSGDMEVLLRRVDLNGGVRVKVVTPVHGFDDIWEKILEKFIRESNLADTSIEINDNNSTPFIVGLRLKQALIEAREKGGM
jgi:malonate decarboxylase acyl carrier protein